MKKFFLCAGVVMCVCVLAFGTAFALVGFGSAGSDKPEKIDPAKPKQTIVIDASVCGKLLSVQNDGSMLPDSPVQKYQIVCDNKGQKTTATMEVSLSKAGTIAGAKIVAGSKTMQGMSLKVVNAISAHEHCIKECVKQGKDLVCYYV